MRAVNTSRNSITTIIFKDYINQTHPKEGGNFDLSEVISSKAKTQNAKTLRERLGKNEDRVKSTRKSSRRNSKLDLDSLDLSL